MQYQVHAARFRLLADDGDQLGFDLAERRLAGILDRLIALLELRLGCRDLVAQRLLLGFQLRITELGARGDNGGLLGLDFAPGLLRFLAERGLALLDHGLHALRSSGFLHDFRHAEHTDDGYWRRCPLGQGRQLRNRRHLLLRCLRLGLRGGRRRGHRSSWGWPGCWGGCRCRPLARRHEITRRGLREGHRGGSQIA